ncbi:hypothetical protein HYV89_02345, partial [Candidatus Woesearchaeota archaeon]|nr:hypothetical protein [Candidatus Woesearchaeota archaeon]
YGNLSFDLGSAENYYRTAYIQTLTLANTLDSGNISDVYLFNTGDTATGDYTFDSPTFFIDSGNNRIGIGTITPANPLNVVGDGNFSGALYVGGVQITADSNVSGGGTANYIVKFLAGTTIGNSLIYDDGTFVGIDTTAPQGKLEITNSTALTLPWLNVTDGANGIKFVIDNAGRVGIGRYPTGDILEISGSILATANLTIQGAAYLGDLQADLINTTHIAADTILAGDIAAGAVATSEILDRTIIADDIADNILNTTLILDRTLLSDDLADSSVNSTIILDNTITTEDILLNTINGSDIDTASEFIIANLSITDNITAQFNFTVVDSVIIDYIYANSLASTVINNATITNDLRVLGNSYLGTLIFDSNGTFPDSVLTDFIFPESSTFTTLENITVNKDVHILGTLYGGSPLLISGSANLSGNFTLVDDSILADYIYSYGLPSTVINNLSVTNDIFVTGNLSSADSLNSDFIFPKSASFTRIDNVTITNDLRVLGSSYLGSFIIKDDLNVGQTNITSTFTGIGAINPLFLLHLNISDDLNETITPLLVLEKTNSSTGSGDGYGSSILFRLQDDAGEMENISMISGILSDVSNGTERADLVFYTGYGDVNGIISNLSSAEALRISSEGNVSITNNLAVKNNLGVTSDLNVEGLCVAEDSLITLANGEKKQIKDIKEGESVLSLNEETGKLVPTKVNSLLDMGFKPIYELTTESGSSVNTTSTHPYLVKINSKEKCEEYSDNVWNKNNPESYDNEDYCLRWVSVKDLKEGDEIAAQKDQERPNNDLTSAVENTLTLDCNLCLFSSDHNGISLENERAKYGASLVCSGKIDSASVINDEYSDLGTSLMYLNSKLMKNSSSGFDNPESCSSLSLRLPISSDKNSGEYNLYPLEDRSLIRSSINPLLINAWNTMLASITKDFISNNQEASECLFAIPDFTSSANLNACAFVNLLLDKISLAKENSKSSINSFTTVSRAISNLSFNSEGISTLKTTSDIKHSEERGYLNLLNEEKTRDRTESVQRNWLPSLPPQLINEEHNIYLNLLLSMEIAAQKENQSPFLFLNSSHNKLSLTLNSLNFVSILNNSVNTPPNNISIIGGDPIIPSNFNKIINNANRINPQAIIPNTLSINSPFIYSPLDPPANNPTPTPKTTPANKLNQRSNLSNKLNSDVTATNTALPTAMVLYSFDDIINSYLKPSEKNQNDDIKFEKITSINILEEQHVYDLAMEGNNNFIANDIIAHNTYLAGNVSINDNLTVGGSAFYVDKSSGNVGIGTTAPIGNLHVIDSSGSLASPTAAFESTSGSLYINLTGQGASSAAAFSMAKTNNKEWRIGLGA